ncbi:elongation of very long chain fatty acids protein 7-like [Anopheles cruzii]|uniref:elongation of very long chain fatty acids protein 7-like n=1 Tax=Anopheles cruzii TaxID=68878 RepID=UPI0022EC3F05|nr:elongation of very long chain fatty acids protein 7-like [Anopheles cruzii]
MGGFSLLEWTLGPVKNPKGGPEDETLIIALSHPKIWNGAWMYLMLKIVELLDTVFFVLRKKQNQVSFLHVYHHTIMVLFTWFYLKYIPGMEAAFIGVLNSFVHIIMYTYYLIAALGPRYQKYLWWKRYMTTLQLLQFGIMLCYFGLINSMQCAVPRALTYFFVSNITIFLFLFINFYRKAYQSRVMKRD